MAKDDGFSADKAMEQIKGDKNLTWVAGGAAVAIVGLFLPWYSFEFFGISSSFNPGLEDDGLIITLLSLGAVAFALNVFKRPAAQSRTIALVLAILAVVTVIMNWPDGEASQVVSVGLGYYVSLIGTVVASVGAWKLKQGGASSEKPAVSENKE